MALLAGFAATASAQPDPPPGIPGPAPGVTPVVVVEPSAGPDCGYVCTATDRTLWGLGGGPYGGPATPFLEAGRLLGPAALLSINASSLRTFGRGTDDAGYYTRYPAGAAGSWRSMGGKLTSGVSAATDTVSGKITTYTAGLGTSNGIFSAAGTWTS